jgi:hypothetical protein
MRPVIPEIIFVGCFCILVLYSIRAAIHDAGEKIAVQIKKLREEIHQGKEETSQNRDERPPFDGTTFG